MSIDLYLQTEFRRYFPDALEISVEPHGETIIIGLILPELDRIEYIHESGSDDNFFRFESEDLDSVITIPFQSEAPTTVLELWDTTFPHQPARVANRQAFAEIPTESTCGDDCRKVIEAAKALYDLVVADSVVHNGAYEVCRLAERQVRIYITG